MAESYYIEASRTQKIAIGGFESIAKFPINFLTDLGKGF